MKHGAPVHINYQSLDSQGLHSSEFCFNPDCSTPVLGDLLMLYLACVSQQ